MRDYRDAKAMARTLRTALAARGMKISIAESLELIAKAFGTADWNTLSAHIRETSSPPPVTAAGTTVRDWTPAVPWSTDLVSTFSRATESAERRRHRLTTIEHVVLALIDDPEGCAAMETCGVDLAGLRSSVERYVEDDLQVLADLAVLRSRMPDSRKADVDRLQSTPGPTPTAGLRRAAVRATDFANLRGMTVVTGRQMLAAIVLSAGDCQGAGFLAASGMTRQAALELVGGAS